MQEILKLCTCTRESGYNFFFLNQWCPLIGLLGFSSRKDFPIGTIRTFQITSFLVITFIPAVFLIVLNSLIYRKLKVKLLFFSSSILNFPQIVWLRPPSSSPNPPTSDFQLGTTATHVLVVLADRANTRAGW